MAGSQLLSALNRAFNETIKRHSYFSKWKKDGTRGFWQQAEGFGAGIVLRISKFWDHGGDFLIEIAAGLRIKTNVIEDPNVLLKDGCFCVCQELIFKERGDTTVENDGRWFSIHRANDLPDAMSEIVRIIDRDAIPWWQAMKHRDAFAKWVAEHTRPFVLFPLTLEMHGPKQVRHDVCTWMATCPRNVDSVFQWFAENSIFDQPFCDRLRRATLQSKDNYADHVAELINEVHAANT